MNTLTDDLVTRLKADATVTALVGTRVYDQASPVTVTTPYLTVTSSVQTRLTALDGSGGTAQSRVVVTCWGGIGGDLDPLTDAVIDELDNVVNTIMGGSGGTQIQTLNYLNTQEIQGPIDHVGPVPVEGVAVSFDCWHQE